MAEIVNLRRARKSKARDERAKRAADNRAQFGTPKHARDAARANNDKAALRLARHKIEREDEH